MARIRTIKPEFFRHEGLQDLEAENPGACVMLVFAGLWGHCDKAGRFEWKPRTLKLDILPFIEFDMGKTLALLCVGGFVRKYEIDGKQYGEIRSFEKHQRINGKESQEPEKHPAPCEETQQGDSGSNGEATGKQLPEQEGKGREEEGKRKGTEFAAPSLVSPPEQPPLAVAVATPPKKPEKAETDLHAACRKTWEAYSEAYAEKYEVRPIRAAKQSSQVKQIVQSLGADEAPLVVAWFVQHPAPWYVSKGHDIGLLLTDIVKLRTEWATGRLVQPPAPAQTSADRSRNFMDSIFGGRADAIDAPARRLG